MCKNIFLLPNGVADVDVEELGVVAVHGGDGGGTAAAVPPRVDLRGLCVEPVLDLGPEDKLHNEISRITYIYYVVMTS